MKKLIILFCVLSTGCASAYQHTYVLPKSGFIVYEVSEHEVQVACIGIKEDDEGAVIPPGTKLDGCTRGDTAWISYTAPKCTWLHEICHLLREDLQACSKICQE